MRTICWRNVVELSGFGRTNVVQTGTARSEKIGRAEVFVNGPQKKTAAASALA